MEHLRQGDLESESPQEFAARVGLPIQNSLLLSRALTHRSYLNEHGEALEDNERLEFLGDAVLDFLVGAWLYRHCPELREGGLTRLRSALVRTEQLAEFARQINLGNAMRLGKGEAHGGGRDRLVLLCATFEALIGALFLDAGLPAVQSFFEPFLEPVTSRIIASQLDQDAKSLFQERVQSFGYPPPQYRLASENGPEHEKTFEVEVVVDGRVVGRGSGRSKQAAAKIAAQAALDSMELEEF